MYTLWSEVPNFIQNYVCIFSFCMIWLTNRNYFGVQTVREKPLCMILFDGIVSNFMDLSGQKDFLFFRQYHTKPASVDVKQRKAPRSFNLQIPSTTNSELTWVQSSKKAKESSLVRVRSYVCGMSVSVPEDLRASEFTELGKNFCLFVGL